jgi:hypothetical protein
MTELREVLRQSLHVRQSNDGNQSIWRWFIPAASANFVRLSGFSPALHDEVVLVSSIRPFRSRPVLVCYMSVEMYDVWRLCSMYHDCLPSSGDVMG